MGEIVEGGDAVDPTAAIAACRSEGIVMKVVEVLVGSCRRILGISAEEIRYTFEDVRAEIRAVRAELAGHRRHPQGHRLAPVAPWTGHPGAGRSRSPRREPGAGSEPLAQPLVDGRRA